MSVGGGVCARDGWVCGGCVYGWGVGRVCVCGWGGDGCVCVCGVCVGGVCVWVVCVFERGIQSENESECKTVKMRTCLQSED